MNASMANHLKSWSTFHQEKSLVDNQKTVTKPVQAKYTRHLKEMVILLFALPSSALAHTYTSQTSLRSANNRALSLASDIDWTQPIPFNGNTLGTPSNTHQQLASGRGNFAVGFDAETAHFLNINDSGKLISSDPLAELTGTIKSISVNLNQALILTDQNTLYLFQKGPNQQPSKPIAIANLESYFDSNFGGAQNIALDGNRAMVVGKNANGYQALVVLDKNGDQFSKTIGTLLLEPGQAPIKHITSEGDFIVVSNDEKALAINIRPTENLAPFRYNGNNLCVGKCVDSLLVDEFLYQVSEGGFQIYRIPKNPTEFDAEAQLQALGDLSVSDGAKLMGLEQLGNNRLAILKNYDKLIIVDITDKTKPAVLDTITINHFKENGFTEIRIIDTTIGPQGVMLGKGTANGIFTFSAASNKEQNTGSSHPSTLTNTTTQSTQSSVDLSPYLSEANNNGRSIAPYGVALTFASIPGGLASFKTVTELGTDGFSGNFYEYQGTAFTGQEDIAISSGLIHAATPALGTTVSVLASVRSGMFLKQLNSVEKEIDQLYKSIIGLSQFTQSDAGFGKTFKNIGHQANKVNDWTQALVTDLRSAGTTSQEIMEARGINRYLDKVQETLIEYLDASDQLDDTDLLIDFEVDGILSIFVGLFEAFASEIFTSGYDGTKKGSFTEESIAAAINHVIRSMTNSRLISNIIANVIIDATRSTILESIDKIISHQDTLETIEKDLNRAILNIEDQLIPQINDTFSGANSVIKRTVGTVKSLTSPAMLFMASGLLGIAGTGIASVLLRNAHSAIALLFDKTGFINDLSQAPKAYDRTYDTLSLLLGLGTGVGFAENVRQIESDFSNTIYEVADLTENLANLLDSSLEISDALPKSIKHTLSLLQDTLNEVQFSQYSLATKELLESGEIFSSDIKANDPAAIGTNIASVIEGMTSKLAATNSDQFTQAAEEIAKKIEALISDTGAQIVAAILEKQLRDIENTLPLFKNFIERLDDDLKNVSTALNELGDNISHSWLRLIEYIGTTLAMATLVVYLLVPIKGLLQKHVHQS